MSNAGDQQMSHADRHDLDKLARWKADLDSADFEAHPLRVCAIFLVSPEDRMSHDIFRRYRSAFEELGGGFHHLVIFGQHGISRTQVAFLNEVGMDQTSVPLLAIAPLSDGAYPVYCIRLPGGDRNGDLDVTQVWGTALDAVSSAVNESSPLTLSAAPGVSEGKFRRGSLASTVDGTLVDLSG